MTEDQLPAPASHLKNIAETGNVDDIKWADLQTALKTRLEQIIETYQQQPQKQPQENDHDDNFDLESSRDELFDLIGSLTGPPFTIQRICELLNSPLKYYDRTSTFFRGLEKNLRVVSSSTDEV